MEQLSLEAENAQQRRQIEALESIADAAIEAHEQQVEECQMWRERAQALRRKLERDSKETSSSSLDAEPEGV